MSDEQVIQATTQVLGIGRWTAEMLLIFCLERPDVWPIDDLGIRKAVRNLLGDNDLPHRDTITGLAEPWRPFRSYASWYLWRSLEGPLMPGRTI
jgi:DNA-3-methyladenine glycosylase II